jgi:hypothetical protein
VGMEACATAHYGARELRALGHEVRLMPAQYVTAHVKRDKTTLRMRKRFVSWWRGRQCASEVKVSDRDLTTRQISFPIKIRMEKEMTKLLAVTLAAVAMFICGSAAIAQDARARADRLESDVASGIQPNGSYPAQPRINLAHSRIYAAHMGGAARV